MENNWSRTNLGDIVKFSQGIQVPVGKQFESKEKGLERFIRIVDFTNESEPERYIDKPSDKYLVNGSDIVMIRYGSQTAGKVVRGKKGYIANNMFKIDVISEDIDKGFLYYLLGSATIYNYLISTQSSSTMPAISFGMLKNIEIKYPTLEVQKKITKCLDNINNKIQLNSQSNPTLEKMAQLIFKSWFVDFDPVIDNALITGSNLSDFPEVLQHRAEHRKKAQQLIDFKPLPDDIRKLFPNEFEQTDDPSIGIEGWIPKGWKVSSIDKLNAINPESWTNKNAPETVKYVDLASAKKGTILETVDYLFTEAPSRARRVLNKHDIIIGVVRPVNRSFAYVNECGLTGSTGFAVVRSIKESYRAFTYLSLTNDDCIAEFARIADGAAYPAIKPDDVAKAICVYSNEDILEEFEKIAGQFLAKKAASEQQLKPLASLRDTLLPKLISGEITINKEVA